MKPVSTTQKSVQRWSSTAQNTESRTDTRARAIARYAPPNLKYDPLWRVILVRHLVYTKKNFLTLGQVFRRMGLTPKQQEHLRRHPDLSITTAVWMALCAEMDPIPFVTTLTKAALEQREKGSLAPVVRRRPPPRGALLYHKTVLAPLSKRGLRRHSKRRS